MRDHAVVNDGLDAVGPVRPDWQRGGNEDRRRQNCANKFHFFERAERRVTGWKGQAFSNTNCCPLGSRKPATPSPSNLRGRDTSLSRPNKKHPNRYMSFASINGSSTVIWRVSVVKSP